MSLNDLRDGTVQYVVLVVWFVAIVCLSCTVSEILRLVQRT